MNKETLKSFVPFSELREDYFDEILAHIELATYTKGQMIFKRGKVLDDSYFLVEGMIDLIDSHFESQQLEAGQPKSWQALNLESPTSVSCVAKSEVTVFKVDQHELDRCLAWSQSSDSYEEDLPQTSIPEGFSSTTMMGMHVEEMIDDSATDWMSSLLQAPLFSKIPISQVQELFVKFQNYPVSAGDVVIREGEMGDYFYVISAGVARVTDRTASVDLQLEAGMYFGEEALLGQTPRNATVTMETAGLLKRLDAESFRTLLTEPVLDYIDTAALHELQRPYQLLDVKMPIEYRMAHFEGCMNLPLSKLRSKISDLNHEQVYVVADDAGSRADIAAHLLCQAGFDTLILKTASA